MAPYGLGPSLPELTLLQPQRHATVTSLLDVFLSFFFVQRYLVPAPICSTLNQEQRSGEVKAASREQLKVPVVEGRWRTVRGNTFRSRLKSFTVNPRFYSVMVLRCSRRLWDHRPPTLWNVCLFVFFTCLILFCPSNILKRNLAIKDCFKEGKKKAPLVLVQVRYPSNGWHTWAVKAWQSCFLPISLFLTNTHPFMTVL